MFIFNFYSVISCVVFAKLTQSYSMYIIDMNGHLSKPTNVIHVDTKEVSSDMRKRLEKQLNEFLRKRKMRHYNPIMLDRTIKKDKNELTYFRTAIKSPVVYSNGRYTLDLDTIDVQDVKQINKNHKNVSSENLQDYYDYVDINDRLAQNVKIPWRQLKHLTKYIRKPPSSRKYNKLLGDEKYFKSRDLYDTEDNHRIKKKKKYSQKKRFQIIGNKKKINKYDDNDDSWEKHVEKMKRRKPKFDSDYYNPNAGDFSAEKPKKLRKKKKKKHKKVKSEEVENEDDGLYLQGNVLIKINPMHFADSGEDKEDRRRRLPHFLPKRYHWEPDDIHKLGYFWFNGPRGKYPSPVLAE